MPPVMWVALGGALGSAARYGVNEAGRRWLAGGFPWATLLVNVSGSFAMGLLAGLFVSRLPLSDGLRLFLTTGILGGFTTFSAFSLDFALLAERRDWGLALAYAGASVALSIAAVFAGLNLARELAA